MTRIPLLSTREGLNEEQASLYDWIVESRGTMIRPYEVLMHTPGLARPAAELGAQIRYSGTLSDHDRELGIITTATMHDCAFEWDSHVGIARDAGVAETTIEYLQGAGGEVNEHDDLIIEFVREVCTNSDVSDERFAAAAADLGQAEVIELTALVGYYTFLGFVMRVANAC